MLQQQVQSFQTQNQAKPSGTPPMKVLLIGPSKGGKTKLANIVRFHRKLVPFHSLFPQFADLERDSTQYQPTVGCRIVQSTEQISARTNNNARSNVIISCDVWDASGSMDFEPCWPALAQDCGAVIAVYDVESKQQFADVKVWCEKFLSLTNLSHLEQLAVFAHSTRDDFNAMSVPKTLALSVRGATGGTISVPITFVSTSPSTAVDREGAPLPRSSQPAKLELRKLLGEVYRFSPHAELD